MGAISMLEQIITANKTTKQNKKKKKKLCENVQNDEIENKEMITNEHQSDLKKKLNKTLNMSTVGRRDTR